MPRKIATITALDRERMKERLKTLIFAGHNVRNASQMCGIEETTAQKWATRYGWRKEIQRAKELAPQSSKLVPNTDSILFDRAATNRQTRSALAQILNITAVKELHRATEGETIPILEMSDLKSLVQSAAQVAGDWEDSSASKLAVDIRIAQIASDPRQVRELSEAEVRELEAGE